MNARHCILPDKAYLWMNGELLGDGNLRADYVSSAAFRGTSQYLEYIDYISGTLSFFGIEQSGKIYKRNNVYYYTSRRYYELGPLRCIWYPDGKKIVPKCFHLTPLVCRQWYIGDGCLKHREGERPHITLATCGFPANDVIWLVEQLWEIGIIATRQACENRIHISTHSTPYFLKYIGKCPVECYQYKWRY